MKRIISTLLLIASSSIVFAQEATNKIVLVKNQQLKFTTTVTSNINSEMGGQSMASLTDVTSIRNITVKDIFGDNYQLDAVVTHIKMNMSAMGMEKKFDSDNKDDMAGDMKAAGKDVNVVKKFTLSADNKNTTEEKDTAAKSDEGGMANTMQQMFGPNLDATAITSYFMLIPNGKKTGDSWTDSVTIGTTKTLWNFTWDSTLNNTALITAVTKSTINKTINPQGMEIKMNLASDVTEKRKIELKSGVILNRVSISKIDGTMEAMGQSMPMSGTNTITIVVE